MRTLDAVLWYFAYGSNLDPAVFEGRRRIRALEVCCVRLEGWQLVFDLPVGPGERAVANLRAEPGATVHGVAYRISRQDGRHLDRTEGVHRGYYKRVTVELLGTRSESLEGFTYASPHGRAGRKPSRRYLELLLRGAAHHGLPADYVRWLEGHELAVDEREVRLRHSGRPG
ncbi:MAG: gamma-glutamylcyclotransferase family protein [Myxococcota bacterium]